jgi:hypothetical protein
MFSDSVLLMLQAAITEFPFVEALPKRERSKFSKLWDHLTEVREVVAQKGALVPQHMVADLLDVSRQRICALVDEGRFDSVEVHGVRYITADSVEVFAKQERSKCGRPRKSLDNRKLWKASLSSACELVKKVQEKR